MAVDRVRTRLLASLHPVGDVAPVIGRDVAGVDAAAFDRIDVA